ncbi:hypothetical protein IKQ26_01980 [bacterium]|nr:hypothetical protein [bacterium]
MQISSNYNVSFGHIYSNAVDSVLKRSNKLTQKQENQIGEAVEKAAAFKKSVITSSTTKGLVLLTADKNGQRQLEKTYPMGIDAKTNIEQLETAVKDAEKLEKLGLPEITPAKKVITGTTDYIDGQYYYPNIYKNVYNGYNTTF